MSQTSQVIPLKLNEDVRGAYGTLVSAGIFHEEFLNELRGIQGAEKFDKMRTQDAQIKMVLSAVTNPIKSATWDVRCSSDDPDAQSRKEFVEFILFKDMYRTWQNFINEALTFIVFGHSVFEIIHKNVKNHSLWGNYTGIQALSWRSPKTINQWNIDNATGELRSIYQIISGDQSRSVEIPAEFLLILTMDLEGADYASSTKSLLRPCYGPWFRKNLYLKLEGIGHEKHALGTPIGTVPAGKEATEDKNKFEQILQAYSTHELQYIIIPEGFKIDIVKGEFDADKLRTSVNNENQEISRAFLGNFLNLGQGNSSGGSFALGSDLTDFFLKGIQYISKIICDAINCKLIPHIIGLNFGPQDEYPYLECTGIEDVGKEFADTIAALSSAGILVPDQKLEEYVRKLYKLTDKQLPDGVVAPEEEITQTPDPQPDRTSEGPTEEVVGIKPQVSYRGQPGTSLLADIPSNPTSLITKTAQGLAETMVLNLDAMANKLINDIISRYKSLPEASKAKAINKIQVGGKSKYKKEMRTTLANISDLTLRQVKTELKNKGFNTKVLTFADPLGVNEPFSDADFNGLPGFVKNKIVAILNSIIDIQGSDLEKAAFLQFGNSIGYTIDPTAIAADMKSALDRVIAQIRDGGSETLASQLTNDIRNDVFDLPEVKPEVESFTFLNPDPVTAICKSLNGRTFEVDDAASAPYRPPLHHNCKSYLRANLKGNRNPDVNPAGLAGGVTDENKKNITLTDKGKGEK